MIGIALFAMMGGGGISAEAPVVFHFLGDSMLDGGGLVAATVAALSQAHATTQDGVGGSELEASRDRFAATPQYWGDTLVVVDAGSTIANTVNEIFAYVTSGKHLYVEASYGLPYGYPGRVSLDAVQASILSAHPGDYVPTLPEFGFYGDGSGNDFSDTNSGVWPRSLRQDSIHPNAAGKIVFGRIIAAAIIAKGWDGNHQPANRVPPGISRAGDVFTARAGYWTAYPAVTLSRQWRANGVNISGQTGATYTPTGYGDTITCVETATNAVGSTSSTSNSVVASAPGTPLLFNAADKSASITLSNGGRTAQTTVASYTSVRGTQGWSSGKVYFEFEMTSLPSGNSYSWIIGIGNNAFNLNSYVGGSSASAGVRGTTLTSFRTGMGAGPNPTPDLGTGTGISPASGDRVCMHVDVDAGKAWMGKNGPGLGDPAAGTGEWTTFTPGMTIFAAMCAASLDTRISLPQSALFAPASGYTVKNG